MFTLVKEPLAWITVEWPGLAESGDAISNSIRMKVALMPLDDMNGAFDPEGGMATLDLVKKVAREWDGVADDSGVMACTPENIDRLVNTVPNFASGFVKSYMKGWLGQVETREKNSASSPDDGRAEKAAAAETTSPPSAAPKA